MEEILIGKKLGVITNGDSGKWNGFILAFFFPNFDWVMTSVISKLSSFVGGVPVSLC